MNNLTEESPSVQTHLALIQGVIQRMSINSVQCKTWCITLVSAILVIVADKGKPDFVLIALLPTILFFALDAYYLSLEKGFRHSYNIFVKKLHEKKLLPEDLYSVVTSGGNFKNEIEAIKSFSVWGFYLGLIGLLIIARFIVLA